jgi:hypothetical protein
MEQVYHVSREQQMGEVGKVMGFRLGMEQLVVPGEEINLREGKTAELEVEY